MSNVRFLKGMTPEHKHPATAKFPDSDDVSFTAVFHRLDKDARADLNVVLMQVTTRSIQLRKQLQEGEVDAVTFGVEAANNNQVLVNEMGKHLIRCEGLMDGNGSAFSWSDEVYQMMIRSDEYGSALGVALREMAAGKRVEAEEAKNSTNSATSSTGATVVELQQPA